MRNIVACTLLATSVLLLPVVTAAQVAEKPQVELPRPQVDKVATVQVLEAAQRNTGKSFLVDHRVPPAIVVGQVDLAEIDYTTFLMVLRNNDLAAVAVDEIVNVVPVGMVRQFPLPVIEEEDESINDEEWVTWVIQLRNAEPGSVVPIMRPIMPQAGHLAANPNSRTVLIVDRYGNAKRVVELIRQLDAATPRQ